MKRSASEILRNLEMRIARLEKSSSKRQPTIQKLLDLVAKGLPFRTYRHTYSENEIDMIKFDGPKGTLVNIKFNYNTLRNGVMINVEYDIDSGILVADEDTIVSAFSNLFGRGNQITIYNGLVSAWKSVRIDMEDMKELKQSVNLVLKEIDGAMKRLEKLTEKGGLL